MIDLTPRLDNRRKSAVKYLLFVCSPRLARYSVLRIQGRHGVVPKGEHEVDPVGHLLLEPVFLVVRNDQYIAWKRYSH